MTKVVVWVLLIAFLVGGIFFPTGLVSVSAYILDL